MTRMRIWKTRTKDRGKRLQSRCRRCRRGWHRSQGSQIPIVPRPHILPSPHLPRPHRPPHPSPHQPRHPRPPPPPLKHSTRRTRTPPPNPRLNKKTSNAALGIVVKKSSVCGNSANAMTRNGGNARWRPARVGRRTQPSFRSRWAVRTSTSCRSRVGRRFRCWRGRRRWVGRRWR